MALTIDELNIQIAADSSKASRALTNLIKKLEKLNATMSGTGVSNITISNAFNKTTNSINKAADATEKHEKVTKSSTKTTKAFTDSLARNITKWRTLFGVFQNAANTMSEWFTSSNDYVETLNLFNVTMGEGAKAAREYALRVSEAMGIDDKDWMQYQGTFKSLTAGFGIVEDKANTMSQNLTQLSYDLASFWNRDVEEAFDKLSSAMSGQVKGLREFGIDTTVATLQEYALSQGIEKSVRSMTQAEKSMLRYNYIMEQSANLGVWNDMARTIITPANSIRILTAQLAQMKRALGNIVSVIVVKFIPYVQAMVQIVTEAADAIAKFFGFNLKDYEADLSGIKTSGFADEIEDEFADGAEAGIKAMKKQLMGFDELNIISNPDSSSSDTGTGAGGPLDMSLIEYDFLKGLKTDKLDEIKEKLNDILKIALPIGAAFAAWKLSDGFIEGVNALKLFLKNPFYAVTLGLTLTIAGFATEFAGIKDAIQNGLDGLNFAEILGGGLLGTAGAALLGSQLAVWIETAFAGSAIDLAITQAGINLGLGATSATGAVIGGAFAAIIAGIPMYITGIYDAIVNGLNWLNGLLIPLGATLAGAGIGAVIGMLGGPIGAGVGALVGIVVGLLTDFTIGLWQHFDAIAEWFNNLPWLAQGAVQLMFIAVLAAFPIATIPIMIGVAITAIKTKFWGLWTWFEDTIIAPLSRAGTWVYTTVFAPIIESIGKVFTYAKNKYTEIKDGLVTAFTAVFSKVKEISDKIKEIFSALWWAFKEYVWNPIADRVSQFYNDKIKPVVDKVKGAFTEIWNWFKTKVYDQIVKQVDTMKTRIEKFGTGIIDTIAGGFKGIMNNIFWQIELFINTFISGLNAAIGLINKIPGVEITKVSYLEIPRLAEGGIVNEGQMFIAREAGPELVGSIGNKTAVANNDQIISGIEAGVYRAMMAANSGNRGGTQTIRIVNEIDGSVVGEKVIQYHNGKVMQTGVSPLLV